MKNLIAVMIAGLFLAGCVSNAPKSAVSAPKAGKYSYNEIQDGIRPMNLQGNAVQSDACKQGNGPLCFSFAESMYAKGDFASAANAYNMACTGTQNFPACMKLADMFERGQGVEKNIFNAIDLYRVTCYYGYKNACANMRRLGYNG
ncbi:hypothetical protein OFO03_00900 [Campylobacter sp. JMF_02 ED1]|uniref:hypothetical protein n=1 Tax=unclassified Campylobacter TaxID=2593542 RepID=UPI0022E9C77A|nr:MULTISPECIES: hypothetical protein [unclassified Campylobacter]MDA3048824.1 hypothetical protein [Campylobacter sp. JMF_15 NE4]MDA3050465.1 hypothetical protein [Campylobacter sp. JMF_02 ED1]MDA3061972.1 hypothetical protein [Campylobacter sp. JMF_14 EL1]MDA3072923.1 hypothetical protein [Campylobacter sp. JMF_10 EL2]MDA3075909.1 hypothetical protein [Campylobacter sp. JMF_04 NA10]